MASTDKISNFISELSKTLKQLDFTQEPGSSYKDGYRFSRNGDIFHVCFSMEIQNAMPDSFKSALRSSSKEVSGQIEIIYAKKLSEAEKAEIDKVIENYKNQLQGINIVQIDNSPKIKQS
ncbi:MAG: hypothetical protein ACP5MC_00600 [Candidatus Micrarchaeia archaeon]